MERVLRYFEGLKVFTLRLVGDNKEFKLGVYIETEHRCYTDSKSHSGMILMLGKAPMIVISGKQKIVTKSLM
jgi:hypothetical protein